MRAKGLYDFNRILFVNSYACNMNCEYCMHAEHKKRIKVKGKTLGVDASKKIVDYMLEHTPSKQIQITFSGGEPLIFFNDYIKPMVLYARQREKETGIKIILDMFTNGTLLTAEMCEFFKEQNFILCFSYDGNCGQPYRDRSKDTTPIVEEHIKMAVDIMGDLVACASTFYKDSIPYIYDAYMSVAKLNVKKWSFAIDTLTTDIQYNSEELQLFGDQINKVWKEMPNQYTKCNTFDRITKFHDYIETNKALIIRPDGEINIGTTVPVLIRDDFYKYFTVGYYDIDYEKLDEYFDKMGEFHIHCMGRNIPAICKDCFVKQDCQDVKITEAEAITRKEVTGMMCLENWIISQVIKGNWK